MSLTMYRLAQKNAFMGFNLARSFNVALRSDIGAGPAIACSHLHTSSNRWSTDPAKRPTFIGNLLQNLKSEYGKSKEMQDSLNKFREEAKKLEESDALKEARRKFQNIEGESKQTGSVLKDQISGITGKLKESVEDISKNEAVKKASEFTENISAKTKDATESLGRAAENISKTSAYQTASSAASSLKEELEGQTLGGTVYRPPLILRKRKDVDEGGTVAMEADDASTGVELHKDSRFSQSWQNFKDSNPVVNKFVDYRVKFEESDNPLVRGARLVTDKLQDVFGTVFTNTELSETLTEIVKMDPSFEKEQFLKDCEKDIIPNILEAITRGDLDILEDWCYEAPFNVLATPLRMAKQMGYVLDSKVLDIDSLDLAMGKMMEQGPVLVITFNSQQIMCVKDSSGKVVEGSADKVMRVAYVWVLCRDQTELDPRAAWRLLDLSANSQEQFI